MRLVALTRRCFEEGEREEAWSVGCFVTKKKRKAILPPRRTADGFRLERRHQGTGQGILWPANWRAARPCRKSDDTGAGVVCPEGPVRRRLALRHRAQVSRRKASRKHAPGVPLLSGFSKPLRSREREENALAERSRDRIFARPVSFTARGRLVSTRRNHLGQ